MIGLGTIVNIVLILIGGSIGLFFRKLLSKRITDTILQGLGLAVVFIGISGALSSAFIIKDGVISTQYTLMIIISLAVGGLAGELIGIENKLDSFAERFERKFSASDKSGTFAQGFITATLVFCVGSMSVLGAINDGISRNADILYLKSALDGVSAMVFASTMGVGVLFSVIAVGVYQGLLTILAVFIAPYLNDQVIAQISVVGSVLILGIGLNMLKIAKIKVGNLLPAIIVPIIYFILNYFIKF